jgi:hypothetical protein
MEDGVTVDHQLLTMMTVLCPTAKSLKMLMLSRREKCGDSNVEHWKTFLRFLLNIFKERSRSSHSQREALPLRQLISIKFFYH